MNRELRTEPEIPSALAGMNRLVSSDSPVSLYSANACVGASTVLDTKIASTKKRIAAVSHTMQGSDQWRTQNADKYPASKIETIHKDGKVTIIFHAPDNSNIRPQITVNPEELDETIGGGAYNGMTDAAAIKAALKEIFGLQSIPQDTLTFSAPQRIRQTIIDQIKAVGISNLTLNPLAGEIREMFVLTAGGERLMLNTQVGTIKDDTQAKIDPSTGFWLFNNEVGTQVFRDTIKRLRKFPNQDRKIIWAPGSNQLKEDPNNFDTFLTKCNTVVLNLDEAVDWILIHSDPEFSEDTALLSLLKEETLPRSKSDKIKSYSEGIKKRAKQLNTLLGLINTREVHLPSVKRVIPGSPEVRVKIAQRVADIIHSMGVEEGTIFITDGGHPTISSRKYQSQATDEVKKIQLYIPTLSGDEESAIKQIITDTAGTDPKEYTMGCGDAVAGTILALKQITNDTVLPSTISIIANYVSCLLRWVPYPNLLAVEAAHPGLTKAVMNLALKNLDAKEQQSFKAHQLEPIPEEMKGHKTAYFTNMLQP